MNGDIAYQIFACSCTSSCLLTLSSTQIQKRWYAEAHKIICRTVLSSMVGSVDKSEEKKYPQCFFVCPLCSKENHYCYFFLFAEERTQL